MITEKTIDKTLPHGASELKRIDYLDGWRGIAIGVVLLSHFLPVAWLGAERVNVGRLGVDIFFVLSGLLMSKILFVKRVPLGLFYKRRVSRVFPVFIIYVTVLYGVLYFVEASEEGSNYLYTLFFLRTYLPVEPGIWWASVPIEHLWSLNVEEHGYFLMSMMTLIFFLKGREYIPLLLLGVGAIVLHYSYIRVFDVSYQNLHIRTEVSISHMLISAGYFLLKHKVESFVRSWMVWLAFLVALYCYSNSAHHFAEWAFSPFLLAFVVNHLDRLNKTLLSLLSCRTLRMFGIWSFSIYIWQQPFYHYGVKGGEAFPFAGPILLVVAVSVGVALFYLIENPIRTWLNKHW